MDLGLKGKIALVGGGSRGIGYACAESLLREGSRVAIFSREASHVEKAVSKLAAQFGPQNVMGMAASYQKQDAIRALLDKVTREWGEISIFIGSSGGPSPSPAADTTREALQSALDANLLGLCDLTRQLLPGMRAQNFGRVVYVTTSGVVQPIAGLAASNIARSALNAFAKTLAAEVARDGITINCVMPGKIMTTRLQEITEANTLRDGITAEKQQEQDFKLIPAGRYGDPSELADLVSFLSSERASYITGANIAVDGGLIRGLR